MPIQIKKRISLDFLGEEYKEAYLEFNSVTMREYPALVKQSRELGENAEESIKFVQSFLTERFVGGKFPQGGEVKDVSKEDLLDFDADVFFQCFQSLTGQVSPKA